MHPPAGGTPLLRRRTDPASFRPRSPETRTLLATALVVAVLAVLTAADVGGRAALWENGQWTVAAVGAAAATWLTTTRRGDRWAASVRRWAAIALTCLAAGQIGWDIEQALGVAAVPGLPDVAWLVAVVPVILAFQATFPSDTAITERLAVWLDGSTVFWAIVGTLLLAGAGSIGTPDVASRVLALANPAVFGGVAGACLVVALATRAPIRFSGGTLVLVGLVIFGIAHTAWSIAGLQHQATPGSPAGVAQSIALLVLGFGAATWVPPTEVSPLFDRIARVAAAVLPLAGLGVAAALTVLAEILVEDTRDVAVHVTVALVVVSVGLRQAMLLRGRAQTVDELRSAQQRLVNALQSAESSSSRHRALADERSRVLAASQRLVGREPAPDVLADVLSLVVPEGAIGFVARAQVDSDAVRVIAAHGPRSRSLIGMNVTAPPELAPDLDPATPRASSVRGPRALPSGVAWQPADLRMVVPTAASALCIPLLDADRRQLGTLELIDLNAERILEPPVVDAARLVANQMAVALQNQDLVERLHAQIEEIRRVQDELIQASRLTAIGELAAAVAHEVSNPLTGVLGYADLLLAEAGPEDPSREGLEVIRDGAVRARTTIWALLDFARPRPPDRHQIDVDELVRETVALQRRLETREVAFVERLDPLPPVDLDERAIQRVLLNLIGNARQAIAGRGTITVSTRRDGENVVITVADDGQGMSDEVRRRIFEPFYTTRPIGTGSGLGLAVSLGLVESHLGSIQVASEPGRGTTVEVRLPIRAPTSASSGPADFVRPTPAPEAPVPGSAIAPAASDAEIARGGVDAADGTSGQAGGPPELRGGTPLLAAAYQP
jgi:signal transduction histidine kinase